MIITACVIVSGKVVPNTFNSSPIKHQDNIPQLNDELIGYVVRRACELARAQGFYMGDPNAFVRVEFKS